MLNLDTELTIIVYMLNELVYTLRLRLFPSEDALWKEIEMMCESLQAEPKDEKTSFLAGKFSFSHVNCYADICRNYPFPIFVSTVTLTQIA